MPLSFAGRHSELELGPPIDFDETASEDKDDKTPFTQPPTAGTESAAAPLLGLSLPMARQSPTAGTESADNAEDDALDDSDEPNKGGGSSSAVRQMSPAVEAMTSTVNTAQGRCGLIAGFTYYELSRQGAASVEMFPAYVLLLLIAFSLAVTSAACATFIRVYLRRVHISQWEEFVLRVSPLTRFTYWCFLFASFVWILSMSLMGKVYNPQAHDAVAMEHVMIGSYAFPAQLLTMLPSYVLVPTCALSFLYCVVVSCLSTAHDEAERNMQCEKTGVFLNDVAQQTMDGAKSAADSTMYLLGFTGAGLARYRATLTLADSPLVDPIEVALNIAFWFTMIFAAALLAFTMVCGTHTYVVLSILPTARREALHLRIRWLSSLLPWLVKIALSFVTIGCMFIGYGCSASCDKVLFNDQREPLVDSCYASVALIPLFIGAVSLVFNVGLQLRVWLAHRAAHAEVLAQVGGLLSAGKTGEDFETLLTDDGSAVAEMTSLWASQASLFSGFVFYNLCCFDTDIIQAPITADFDSGVTWRNKLFLVVTMGSFSFGMALVTVAGAIQAQRHAVVAEAVQIVFAEKLKPLVWWMGLLRRLAMYCFMFSFSGLGIVKMTPVRLEPMLITLIGIVMLAGSERYINGYFKEAQALDKHTTTADLGPWFDHIGMPHKLTYPRIQGQLKVMGPHVLFFGAFSYNGINFLFRPEAPLAPFYSIILSSCFILSLTMVLTEGSISAKFVQLEHQEAQKEFFSRKLIQIVRDYFLDYLRVPKLFMGAIILMGPVKLWLFNVTRTGSCPADVTRIMPRCQQLTTDLEYDQQGYSNTYGWIITVGGMIGMFGIWTFSKYVNNRAMAASARTKKEHDQRQLQRGASAGKRGLRRMSAELDPFEDVKEDAELRANSVLFQTGNVFYEVLFTTINPDHAFVNTVYLGFSVATLALGCVALVVGGGIAIWMEDFPTKRGKSIFAHEAQPLVSLLFVLYYSSLVCWLVSMMASSGVKYPHYWGYSFWTSASALFLINLAWGFCQMQQRKLKPAHPAEDGTHAGDIGLGKLLAPLGQLLRSLISVEGGSDFLKAEEDEEEGTELSETNMRFAAKVVAYG